VVVLAAPAGHGKTCLAAQVAAATGGPIAWFLADELDRDRAGVASLVLGALAAAWADLGEAAPESLSDDSALPLLGSVFETLAGPGSLVMDDVHLLPADVLDAIVRTAVAALPPGCRLVLCSRAAVPEALLRVEAMGRAVTVGARELAFDEEECGRLAVSPDRGAELYARTGGWPLAVALLARAEPPEAAAIASRSGHAAGLAELALGGLTRPVRDLLVVVARLPRCPARPFRRLGDRYAALGSVAVSHPGLVTLAGGWCAPPGSSCAERQCPVPGVGVGRCRCPQTWGAVWSRIQARYAGLVATMGSARTPGTS